MEGAQIRRPTARVRMVNLSTCPSTGTFGPAGTGQEFRRAWCNLDLQAPSTRPPKALIESIDCRGLLFVDKHQERVIDDQGSAATAT